MKTFVSLFSGCGGFDLGFIKAGFKCIGAFDINKLAIDVHKKNLGSDVFEHDLSTGTIPKLSHSKIDVVIAGPPCQGFSTAGKRRLNDPRNELLLISGAIAVKIKPKVFILENVTGVTAGSHKYYWDTLKQQLSLNGYQVAEVRCNTNTFGVPQSRNRMLMIAWNNNIQLDISLPQVEGGTLKEAISGITDLPNHEVRYLCPNSDIAKIAKRIKSDQKLCDVRGGVRSVHTWQIPEVFGVTTKDEIEMLEFIQRIRRRERVRSNGDADPVSFEKLNGVFGTSTDLLINSLISKKYLKRTDSKYDLAHGFNGKYRRLSWEKPSLTVDTRFGDPRYFLHPSEDRGFTVREAARIQGFPDDFLFLGQEKDQYRLVGNAVPPPLAYCVASYVSKAFLG